MNINFHDDYLLIQQLKEYINFRNNVKILVKKGNDKFIQNEYYLIDRQWIKKWKKYIGYEEIMKSIKGKNVGDNDLLPILPFIQQKINENQYPQLNNSILYIGDEINPLADFLIINKNCYYLFFPNDENKIYKIYEKCYPIKFSKGKIILILSAKIFSIFFKDIKYGFHNEILFFFEKENPNKTRIIKELQTINIEDWLLKYNFDLDSQEELEIVVYNCQIKLVNKSLILFKKKIKDDNIYNSQYDINSFNDLKLEKLKTKNDNIIKNLENEKINLINQISSFNEKLDEIYKENNSIKEENQKIKDNEKEYKNKIKEYENKIKILEKENEELNTKNYRFNEILIDINKEKDSLNVDNKELQKKEKKYLSKIMQYENTLNNKNQKIEEQNINILNLKNQINTINNNLNNNQNKIKYLINIVKQKEIELIKLRKELKENDNNQENQFINKKEMMCINFISTDNTIQYSVPCIDTDTFAARRKIIYTVSRIS